MIQACVLSLLWAGVLGALALEYVFDGRIAVHTVQGQWIALPKVTPNSQEGSHAD
jgi:hypothetical protein